MASSIPGNLYRVGTPLFPSDCDELGSQKRDQSGNPILGRRGREGVAASHSISFGHDRLGKSEDDPKLILLSQFSPQRHGDGMTW